MEGEIDRGAQHLHVMKKLIIQHTLIVIFIFLLSVLVLVGGCSTRRKVYAPTVDEHYYWIWISREFDDKLIYNSDGTFEHYFGKSDRPRWYGTYTITDRWTDSEGRI
jgi:hypothetical protein